MVDSTGPNYGQWESQVAGAISAELDISNGDAQGFMEANSGEVTTQWAIAAAPEDAAKAIIAWDERKREGFRFAHGGKIDPAGMSVSAYLKAINKSALPAQAQSYLDSMIEDADMDLLSQDDDEVVALRDLLEAEFPDALRPSAPEKPAAAAPAAELTLADYQASLDGAMVMLEFEKKGSKAYGELQDYIDGLKTMIEVLS